MSKTITLTFYQSSAADSTARILPGEEWRDAAARAIHKRFGKGAAAWGWTMDSRQVDNDGKTTRAEYKATVVGRQTRNSGGHPVLAEARVWLSA